MPEYVILIAAIPAAILLACLYAKRLVNDGRKRYLRFYDTTTQVMITEITLTPEQVVALSTYLDYNALDDFVMSYPIDTKRSEASIEGP